MPDDAQRLLVEAAKRGGLDAIRQDPQEQPPRQALVIYDHLLQTQAGERILPVGFSIGAAIAAYPARHRSVAGLILVTPFDSLEVVARDLYWWAPVGLLIRNRMPPAIEFVRGSNVPTALITAEHDAIAPAG